MDHLTETHGNPTFDGRDSELASLVQPPDATEVEKLASYMQYQACHTTGGVDILWNPGLSSYQSDHEASKDPFSAGNELKADHNSSDVLTQEGLPYSVTHNEPAPPIAKLTHASKYFLTDANCYRRLEKELTRFVLSSISANNPRQHVCAKPCISLLVLLVPF